MTLFGPSRDVLVATRGHLAPSWGRLGGLLVPLGAILRLLGDVSLGAILEPLKPSCGSLEGRLGALLGPLGKVLGRSRGPLSAQGRKRHFGASWRVLGPKMAPLTAKLAELGGQNGANKVKIIDPKIDHFLDVS